MTRLSVLLTLALSVLSLTVTGSLYGQSEVATGRLDPFRILRHRDTAPASTHSQTEKAPRSLGRRGISVPVANSGIARVSSVRQQREYQRRLDPRGNADAIDPQRLRSRFSEQSRVSETAAQRATRSARAYSDGSWLGQRTAQQATMVGSAGRNSLPQPTGPELNEARVELQAQRLDPREVNRALVHAANSRAFNRLEHRIGTNGAPNYEQLRSRVSRTGADPRSMNARLGRSLGATGGAPTTARFGSSRVRRR